MNCATAGCQEKALVRPIDRRSMPRVKGIDLEQALNYIDLDQVSIDFIYNHYTASRLTYLPGSRPKLEKVVSRITVSCSDEMAIVESIARFIADEMLWAGYYRKRTGKRLPSDRNATEEDMLDCGYGWCNEQARMFCALTQVAGIPSRLIFASNESGQYGHVVAEALLPVGWITVDQSIAFCFSKNGQPTRACDIWHLPENRTYFEPQYKNAYGKVIDEIGLDLTFGMAKAETPLDGFAQIGYYNYFI